MKIGILGGAGAMGGTFGAHLAQAGEDVVLIDVAQQAVDTINQRGLILEDKAGGQQIVKVKASTKPATLDTVDLMLVFVKCYHTEPAVRGAMSMIGPDTVVMTLQNGWGNAPRIANLVGEERVLVGLTYHSGTLIGPGHVKQAGVGMTYVGELNSAIPDRLTQIADTFRKTGMEVTVSDDILSQIWSKLALNVCTLPTAALLRFTADALIQHDGTLNLMRELLRETTAVAQAQGIKLDFDERWDAITGLLEKAVGARASMLQDVENRKQTEIDVINGAIVAAGKTAGIATPYNASMVWLVKSLEETFQAVP